MTRRKVLVVDDEAGMLHAVDRLLSGEHEVHTFSDPEEALGRAEGLTPELALLDVRMPGMDGFELLRRLKAKLPDLEVILMTGSIQELDGHLIRAIREGAFYFIQKPFDREVLRTLVERALERQQLMAQNREYTRRLESGLEEARVFQRSLLPAQDADVGPFHVAACCVSCSEVGGDLYDYAAPAPGELAAVVADVSGHGVSAAMLTGVLKAAFRSSQEEDYQPLAVVNRVSRALGSFGTGRFATLIACRIRPGAGVLEYVNAGHPTGILTRVGRDPVLLESTGPIVSPIFSPGDWQLGVHALDGEDHLFLHTDGVEEMRSGNEIFGFERVLSIVSRNRAGGAALRSAVLESVREFAAGRPEEDDLSVMSIRWIYGSRS